VPILQSQNNFKAIIRINKLNEINNRQVDMSKLKKYRPTRIGNNIKPKVLSNKREKKTANLARSWTLNRAPINFTVSILRP
jgi:hypothetical protein